MSANKNKMKNLRGEKVPKSGIFIKQDILKLTYKVHHLDRIAPSPMTLMESSSPSCYEENVSVRSIFNIRYHWVSLTDEFLVVI